MKDSDNIHSTTTQPASLRPADAQLLRAAQLGDTEAVQKAISDGANVNCIDPNDGVATPIVHAACNGHRDVVRLLLDNGADPNARNIGTNSALMLAARFGHAEVVKILVSGGADVFAQDRIGDTALENANRHPEIQALLREARNIESSKQRSDFLTFYPKAVRVLSTRPAQQLDANWLIRFLSMALKNMLGHNDLKESVDMLQKYLRNGCAFSINGNLPQDLLQDHIFFEHDVRQAFPQFSAGCRLRVYQTRDSSHSNSPTTILWVFPIR
jgi:ankyrin repeat protein